MTHLSRFYTEQAGMLNGSHMHSKIRGRHGRRGPIVGITHKKNGNVVVRYRVERPNGGAYTDNIEFRTNDILDLETPEKT